MQLTSFLAQPAAQTPKSGFLNLLTTLKGERPPASAAATPPPVVQPTAAAAAVEAAQPSLGQKLLGGVADRQNKYLANQQMLAVISAGLGARLSHIATSVWATLRGPKEPEVEAAPAAPTEAAPASVG